MKPIRALRADEIECRIGAVTKNGVTLLLYKDARCDMTILDEVFTPFGWERRHELINGKEFCTVSIKDDSGEWISKQDCGTESSTAKEKGESSDAFKRACVCWGIGRELYTKTFLFVRTETVCVDTARNKYEMKDKFQKFHVNRINIDKAAGKILNIEIADKDGNIVCSWSDGKPSAHNDNGGRAAINKEADQFIMCRSCGREITGTITTKGKTLTAVEVSRRTNGLCGECFSKSKAG